MSFDFKCFFKIEIESSRFSGLFGSGVKETPVKRPANAIATTSLSSTISTGVKRSSTNDQMAPMNMPKQDLHVDDSLPLDRSISDRFD